MILAGISIATLTGENGVLTKANNAKNDTIVGEEKEQIQLAYNAVLTEKLENADKTEITADELQAELDNLKAEATAQGSNPIKVTYSKTGNTYKVDTVKGEISKVEINTNIISFSIIGDEFGGTDSFEVEKGTTWEQFLKNNNKILGAEQYSIRRWIYNKDTNQVLLKHQESITVEVYYCYPLKNSLGEEVTKDKEINEEQYFLDTAIETYDYSISFEDAIDF